MNYVMNQSNYTVQTLKNVTTYLLQAKGVTVNEFVIPPNVIDKIDKLNMELGPAADTLEVKTKGNSDKLRQVFTLIQSALIAIAGVMPFVSILGLLFSYCGHQHAITIVIFGGWLLVAITFIFFGVSIIFNNVIRDTCMAMEEWVSNSQAETALSNILPCVDQRMTDKTLLQSKEVVNNVVSVVNTAIEYSANFDPSPQDVFPLNYNQSGPEMPSLCSPFDLKLNNNTCGPHQVSFANASWVWQNYTCSISTSGICTTVGRITPQTYLQLVGAVSVSYALNHYAPPLLGFQNCNFVKETFNVITSNYCPKLVHRLEMVSIELGIISWGVPVCLILSVLYANLLNRKKAFLKNHGLSQDS
ncbi:hypothetical protein AQUCO_04100135v1 [Aquilegia coerulea]|uniref:Transmembrane protein n=1 Tax=Aquilegia coerulea TaxID=218851 RepID=A0A2G5CQG6_AQUCA|nr:hypothetical protein AQUCO_04100135v1 [Aquilegia coerulea]